MAGWLPVVVFHLRAHLFALFELHNVERVQKCFRWWVCHVGQDLFPVIGKSQYIVVDQSDVDQILQLNQSVRNVCQLVGFVHHIQNLSSTHVYTLWK